MVTLKSFRPVVLASVVMAVLASLSACEPAEKPLKLTVSKVTKTIEAQLIARTFSLGPNFEIVPRVESIRPEDGKVFVLFQLDVTNAGTAATSFEGVTLVLKGSGLLEGASSLYYLMKLEKREPTYLSIGREVGVQPKEEIKPGASVSWQLMSIVKEGTKELNLSAPKASPASIQL